MNKKAHSQLDGNFFHIPTTITTSAAATSIAYMSKKKHICMGNWQKNKQWEIDGRKKKLF